MASDNSHGPDNGDNNTVSEPTEELRYEGPITFDDDDLEDDYDEPAGGKVFLTTVIIAACVVIMVAVAIWRSSASHEDETQLVELGAPLPADGADTGALPPAEGVGEAYTAQDLANKANTAKLGDESQPLVEDYRAIPDSTPEAEEPPPAAQSAQAASPALSRPEPRTVHQVEVPPQHSERTATNKLADLGRLARSGQIWAAATLGQEIAPGSDRDWTLQVLFACDPTNVKRAFDKVHSDELMVYPARSQGRSCYRLCWGTYTSRSLAEQARSEVPRYFTDSGLPHPLQNSQAR